MIMWCAVLFGLGILAFLDSIFNMGEIFHRINSVLFMLISLGLLIRTTTKKKEQKLEHYRQKIFSLERKIRTMEEGEKKLQEF